MKSVKIFLAFVLTLLLFWITPRFNAQYQEKDYFDASADRFLVDHTSVGRHATDTNPEITAWVTTPADTSSYVLKLFYRTPAVTNYNWVVMSRVPGSYDQLSATIPKLAKGESYFYHLQLQGPDDKLIARIPEQPELDIRLHFEGTPTLIVWAFQTGLMYLAAIYGFLSLFDAISLRVGERKLGKLSYKVLLVALFLVVGGLVSGALVSEYRFGYLWGGWPIGENRSQTMIEILILYWLALPILFKGTLFRFRPEKNIVSAGGAVLLTLIGVLFMILVYLTGDHFTGIPL